MEVWDFFSAIQDVVTGVLHFANVCKCLHGDQINIFFATPTALPSWYAFFGFVFDNIYRVIPYLLGGWKGNIVTDTATATANIHRWEAKGRRWGMGIE